MYQSSNLGPWVALAGLFIGAGLYLGLRESHPPTRPAERDEPRATETAERVDPRVARSAGRAAIEAFLAAQKPTLQRTCWDQAVRAGMDPRPARYQYDVTVGPRGRQVIRSILEAPGDTRVQVAACLQRETPPIEIPPPGIAVSAVISMTFP